MHEQEEMDDAPPAESSFSKSPARILFFIALTVFAAEAAVMLLLQLLPHESLLGEAFTDAALLVFLISPALYFFLFRPMVAHIRARGKIEEILRKNEEEQFKVMIRASLDGFLITDVRGRFLEINDAYCHMLGYNREELLNMDISDVEAIETPEETARHIGKLLETGSDRFETRQRHKNGRILNIEVSANYNNFHGGQIYCFLRDITERVKVERMKTEFVSTVSHELRTPLTATRGSLALLAGGVAGELPAQAKSMIDMALKNSERLILLINDMLDMEKIEAGKMEFQPGPVKLAPLLQQALKDNQIYAEQYQVSYELEGELAEVMANPGVMVNVDSNRLMQVLSNLLSNAAKFSPAGDKVILSLTSNGRHARIAVKDHGSGIPEQFHGQIFQKFTQADSSDTRKKGGTGLGLSIAKAIVEKMGGSIGFESEPNVLTLFFVEFPICEEVK
jgi:PAS domain S-box-containing protein